MGLQSSLLASKWLLLVGRTMTLWPLDPTSVWVALTPSTDGTLQFNGATACSGSEGSNVRGQQKKTMTLTSAKLLLASLFLLPTRYTRMWLLGWDRRSRSGTGSYLQVMLTGSRTEFWSQRLS